ncbi:MAG: menaquinone biosynthesis protein [Planctomycetaceae bacterium]|nr:menaquinone biosynthesis protein [Planctomycetaceae bacterium]
MSFRIATVPYYNAWPLTRYLEEELPGSSLSPWYPSTMRQGLLSGEIDLAMMPVAELAAMPDAVIYGNACIAARGEVKSVLLCSRVPLSDIRRIALDVASRTSITLSTAMLKTWHGVTPERVPLDLDVDLNQCNADAMVVIGDRALAFRPNEDVWKIRIDLGRWWSQTTGLPFVFAAWIGRKSLESRREFLEKGFNTARDRGVADVDGIITEKLELARQTGRPLLVGEPVLRDYFHHAVHYILGPEEQKGLNLFVNRYVEF